MTQADFNKVVASATKDAGFRKQLRDNMDATLAGYDLTPQERADLKARNLGAEPGKPAPKPHAGGKPTPRESFEAKATLDPKTGKWTDNETGREVRPPPDDEDAKPGGNLGGRPVP